MIRFALMICTVAALSASSGSASAHDPEAVAARCVAQVRQLVERCRNATAEETQACVRRINALQAEGEDEAAIRVARACVESARRRTRRCIAEIREVCTRCINYLLDVGEPELAGRVRWNCGDAIDDVERLLERATHAIRAAVND